MAEKTTKRPILLVTLVKGTDLAPKDDNGLSDPFVKITLRGKTVQSKTIPETLNPVWDETFEFQTGSDKDELKFQAWDYDPGTIPDFLGEAVTSKATRNLPKIKNILSKLHSESDVITEEYSLVSRMFEDSSLTGTITVRYQIRYAKDDLVEAEFQAGKLFEEFLEETKVSSEEKERLRQLNINDKKEMLNQYQLEKPLQVVEILKGDAEAPEDIINTLKLVFSKPLMIRNFVQAGGIAALMKFYQKPLIKNMKKEGNVRVDILEIIRDQLLPNENTAVSLVLPEIFHLLSKPIASSKSNKQRIGLWSVLSVIPVVSNVFSDITYDGRALILDALDYFKFCAKTRSRFSEIIDMLTFSTSASFVLTTLILVNCILDEDDLYLRMELRNELLAQGLGEAIEKVKKNSFNNDCINKQITEFEEERSEDQHLWSLELTSRYKGFDLNDPVAVTQALVNGNPVGIVRSLKEILKNLLRLPHDSTVGLTKWLALEKMVVQVTEPLERKSYEIGDIQLDVKTLHDSLQDTVQAKEAEQRLATELKKSQFEIERLGRRYNDALAEIEQLKSQGFLSPRSGPPPPHGGTGPPPPRGGTGPPPPPGETGHPPHHEEMGPPPPPGSTGRGPPPPPGAGGPPPPPGAGGPPPPPGGGGPPPPPGGPPGGPPPPPGGPSGGPPPPPGGPPGGPPPPPGARGPPPPGAPLPPGAPRPPGGLAPRGPAAAKPSGPKPSKTMKPFRWKKLQGARSKKAVVFQNLDPLAVKLDTKALENLFYKEEKKKEATKAKEAKPVRHTTLGSKRAQGVNIFLKKTEGDKAIQKRLNAGENLFAILREICLRFDPEVLTEEFVTTLKNNVGKEEEMAELLKWVSENPDKTPEQDLERPDLFFLYIKDIPLLPERLDCWLFHLKCHGLIEVSAPVRFIETATRSVKKSKSIPRILELLLAVGQFINFGTPLASVTSFDFFSIRDLKDVKSESGTNLYEYFITWILETNIELSKFGEEIEYLAEAAQVNWDGIEQKVTEYESELAKILAITKNIKNIGPEDQFSTVKRLVTEHKKDIDELVESKKKTYEEWSEVASIYGVEPRDVKPEDMFKLLFEFSSEFKSVDQKIKEAQLAEKEKSKKDLVESKRKEIEEKKKALEARKAKRAGTDTPTDEQYQQSRDSKSLIKASLRKEEPKEDAKEEAEATNILQNMLGSLATATNRGGGRRRLQCKDSPRRKQ